MGMASTTIEEIRAKFEVLSPIMDERARRLWAATKARAIGWGGITRVSQATGISHVTILAGLSQLERPPRSPHPPPSGVCDARAAGESRSPITTPACLPP